MRPRFEQLSRSSLAHVTGGGANIGGILQAASPLLGMIPGIGPIASAIMPMIGQMTAGAGGDQQQQQAQQAQAQQGAVPQGAAPQAAAQQSMGSSGGRHRPSVSVSVGTA